MRKDIVALILAGLLYSLMGFAYIHQNFPSKDTFELIIKRLDRIETSINKIRFR